MMTKRFSALTLILLLCCFGTCLPLFCENGKWVIGALKFEPDAGIENNAVNTKTGELVPSDILEKIGNSIVHNVYPDEQLERTLYKLRTERQSLFLQLSAEYKKRDALVLSNYSDFKLKTALSDSQKKIKDIQKKIDANLEAVKKATDEAERKMAILNSGETTQNNQDTEFYKFKNLFKNLFSKEGSLIQKEQIAFYNNDITRLYEPNSDMKKMLVTDSLYEKQIVSAGINTLLTGHFSKYGEYISVYVDMYRFPGSKKIGSAAEVGTMQELEVLTNSIAMQIVPMLANSLPVQLEIEIGPVEAAAKAEVFIDDTLQKIEGGKVIVDSGVHTIQFVSEGYKTAGTSYAFEGNKKYKLKVNFEKPKTGYIQVGLRKPIAGSLLMNGEHAIDIDGKKSQIAINGKEILGEFISEDGETAFFYIPEKMVFDENYVTIKPKPMDRMSYIDQRRKFMYASYSLFMVSLIPTFYTYANYKNYVNLYTNEQIDYQTAKSWQDATNVTRIITIGCGALWTYGLVRYLLAANTVLPQNARQGKHSEFNYYEPEENQKEEIEENKTDGDKKE